MSGGRAGNNAQRSPFGELLVKFRTQRALTQEKLASSAKGESIAPRSITNYERAATDPKDWVLPHRSGLGLLVEALDLDMVDHRVLVRAWDESRTMRSAASSKKSRVGFFEAGREDLLQTVMAAWEKAQSGSPQFVLINGVSGIGKTAFARQLCDEIANSTREVMITWGSNSSWATSVDPYISIRQATDRIFQAPEPTSTVPGQYRSRPKLGGKEVGRIVESIPLLANALISERAIRSLETSIDEELAANINSQLAAPSTTYTLARLEEYCRLLIDLSQSWPIVVVLDDLHWAGAQTTTLLMQLLQSLEGMQNTPILIIGTYQKVEVHSAIDGAPHPLEQLVTSRNQLRLTTLIDLNTTLTPEAGMPYVRAAIAAIPVSDSENAEEFAGWLHAQTSGHPLLTEELIRHLKESNALNQVREGAWTFVPDKIPAHTPSAISAFMEQRLSRVDSMSRRVLEVASVMNDVIITEIVAEILQTDESTIIELIDDNVISHHRLLTHGESLRLLNQNHTVYRFQLGIFRAHVYNSLKVPRRRSLHRQIAEAMETRYIDADTPALSEITSHYIQAEEWHSAEMAGYRQAQHAALKLDWDLAEIWFAQAEELALRAQDPAQLWRARAAHLAVYRGTRKYEDAIKSGKRIIEVSQRHNWPTTTALAHHHLGEIYYDLGQIENTVSHLQAAIALHIQEQSHDLAAAAYSMLSHATNRVGMVDLALQYAQQSLELAKELKNSWVLSEAVLAAANCEIDLGYYEDGIENYQTAIELAQMAGRLNNQFVPSMNIGLCYVFMERYDQAIEVLEKLMADIRLHAIPRHLASPYLYMGYALEAIGRLEEAAEYYNLCAEIRRDPLPQPTLYDAVAGLLRIALAQHDDLAARLWLDELTNQLEANGWEGMEYPLMVKSSIARGHKYFGNEDGFRDYVERAHKLLMDRASMIQSDESRRSYLTNVPMNVDVLELYASLDKVDRQA